jgi:thymidylate synthase ThyX
MQYFHGDTDGMAEILAILGGNGEGAIQLIEKAGRTCYQSQDRLTPDSAAKFVAMINKRGHESVLEHSGN